MNAWHALAGRLALPSSITEREAATLASCYGEPHRAYHTLTHINACTEDWERFRRAFEEPDTALLAILYHDLIYDPASAENEAQSAQMLRDNLGSSLGARLIEKAAAIILATKAHRATGDHDTDLVIDIDMAILGTEAHVYDAYAEGIRMEYEPVFGIEALRAGRLSMFIEPTLASDRIFLTDEMRPKEEQARNNLHRERASWLSVSD
ncbi:MAG: hypothetical protein AAGH41_10125 [Pseudomonadota bacterium]